MKLIGHHFLNQNRQFFFHKKRIIFPLFIFVMTLGLSLPSQAFSKDETNNWIEQTNKYLTQYLSENKNSSDKKIDQDLQKILDRVYEVGNYQDQLKQFCQKENNENKTVHIFNTDDVYLSLMTTFSANLMKDSLLLMKKGSSRLMFNQEEEKNLIDRALSFCHPHMTWTSKEKLKKKFLSFNKSDYSNLGKAQVTSSITTTQKLLMETQDYEVKNLNLSLHQFSIGCSYNGRLSNKNPLCLYLFFI